MFWKYNNTSSSQLETILCKEDVTLQEVMDAEDIINECKYENKALISFLIKPDVMGELVALTTTEPSIELEACSRFKYANVACEMLTCDVPALNERLASDEALLAKLYSFLDNEPPLNPLLASFFSKIVGVLIAKKTEQVLDFLKAKQDFITLLLNHLGTSAIMDLTLKLMTQVEGVEMRQNILNWLDSQQIIQSLVALLDPKVDKERHYNVAQLLCDFIKIARDNQRNSTERNDPDPLLNTLESPDTVSLLLDHVLGGNKVESCIVGGIQVLLALLDVHQVSIPKYDSQNIYSNSNIDNTNNLEERQKVVQSTSQSILKRLKDFHNLLLDPPKKAPIRTTSGILDPPLGNTRLQVTKLIAAVIMSNNTEVMQELATLGTMEVLLDMFFEFQWNNFLHTQVESCITAALKAQCPADQGDCNALSRHLLVNCKLVERILDAWRDNDEQQSQKKSVRKGYMGHLINITNKIVELCSKTSLGQFLKDNLSEAYEMLDNFKETTLSETNTMQETLLGGVHPNTSNEDSDEYGDVPFSQSALSQQQFAQYQIQQLNSQFIESYGFDDDDYNDGDDTLQTIDHRTGMNFDLTENDLVQQHELFKQVCAQNINTLGAADDQIFLDKDQLYLTAVLVKQPGRRDAYNSDSDDDSSPTGADPLADVDPWSSPNKASEAPVISSDPWGSAGKTLTQSSTGWADFSSANFEANFNAPAKDVRAEKEATTASDLKIEDVESDFEVDVDALSTSTSLALSETSKTSVETSKTSVQTSKTSVETSKTSVETSKTSVETVAQVAIDGAVEACGDQPKGDSSVVTNKDRQSLSRAAKEGDVAPVQTGCAEVLDTTDQREPNKEGV